MNAGIAIGRHTHELVLMDGVNVATRKFIANDHTGVSEVCEELKNFNQDRVSFLGNHRWGLAFVHGLKAKGIQSFYFRIQAERAKRGRAGNVSSMLIKVMQKGIHPHPYLREKTLAKHPSAGSTLPPSYRISMEYLDVSDKIRTSKHHLLDCLTILFPEVVKAKTLKTKNNSGEFVDLPVPRPQPPDIFSVKKMIPVLSNPNPSELQNDEGVPEPIRALALNSLGKLLPRDILEKTRKDYDEHLAQYETLVKAKNEKLQELHEKVAGKALYERYRKGDVIAVLTGFLGWREWPNWRELRHFCGLDVSRLDSQGKPRISRVRPEIRMYLYLFATLSTEGKALTASVKRRVKKLERLLKHFWRECLKGTPVTAPAPVAH